VANGNAALATGEQWLLPLLHSSSGAWLKPCPWLGTELAYSVCEHTTRVVFVLGLVSLINSLTSGKNKNLLYIYTRACADRLCRGDRCPERRALSVSVTLSLTVRVTLSLSHLSRGYILFFSPALYTLRVLSQIWHLLRSRKTQYLGEPRRRGA
jgi:hypothetical protein